MNDLVGLVQHGMGLGPIPQVFPIVDVVLAPGRAKMNPFQPVQGSARHRAESGQVHQLVQFVQGRGIKLNFIRPGKPVENAFAESFNGRLRDECLNINWFMSIKHAREVIESW